MFHKILKPKRGKIRVHPTEHEIQVSFFDWLRVELPEIYKSAFAIPNGGYRTKSGALRLKREGVKPGVPDVCIAMPSEEFNGLWLEFKRPGGTLSESQKIMISRLRICGYKVEVVNSLKIAQECVNNYLNYPVGQNKRQAVGLMDAPILSLAEGNQG
jgi:hypothetical protein